MNAIEADRRASMLSPGQAALGAFFGGPIAFAYFVRRNYVAIGNRSAATRARAIGILLTLAWNALVALPILMAKPVPIVLNAIFATPFGLAIAAYRIAERQLESRYGTPAFCSAGHVLGRTALCLLASVACTLATIAASVVFLLATSGFRT